MGSGFNTITSDESIMFADNMSFDGTQRGGKATTNGQLYIGATIAPHIKLGSLISPNGTVSIGYSSPNITLDVSGNVFTNIVKQVFTTSGVYTPTLGMIKCEIICLGGGGGGGGCGSTNGSQVSFGDGGGGGEYAVGLFSATAIGVSKVVTIGAGGTAGTVGGVAGGTGGTSSVGTLITAVGGVGGVFGAGTGAGSGIGGAGGTGGTGGDYRTPGYGGGASFGSANPLFTASGAGANSQLGAGGQPVPTTGNGNPGLGYGAGGSGACNILSAGFALSGGAGSAGIVIITEYI